MAPGAPEASPGVAFPLRPPVVLHVQLGLRDTVKPGDVLPESPACPCLQGSLFHYARKRNICALRIKKNLEDSCFSHSPLKFKEEFEGTKDDKCFSCRGRNEDRVDPTKPQTSAHCSKPGLRAILTNICHPSSTLHSRFAWHLPEPCKKNLKQNGKTLRDSL